MSIRNFCFTLNNPTAADKDFWRLIGGSNLTSSRTLYLIVQEERANSGTLHLQGYVEMSTQRTQTTILNVYDSLNNPHRLHIERRRGSQAQAITYCKKLDSRVENGFQMESGTAKRGGADNLRIAAAALQQGSSILDIASDYPATDIQFHEKIIAYRLRSLPKRNEAPFILCLWGRTGTGKTAWVAQHYPNAYRVPCPEKGGWWWYNYQGQTVALFDDFNGWCKYKKFLRMCDRYAFTVQAKGTSMDMLATTLIFTSNVNPIGWYQGVNDTSAWLRRLEDFGTIRHFTDDSTWEHPKWEGMSDTSENLDDPMDEQEDDLLNDSTTEAFLAYGMDEDLQGQDPADIFNFVPSQSIGET